MESGQGKSTVCLKVLEVRFYKEGVIYLIFRYSKVVANKLSFMKQMKHQIFSMDIHLFLESGTR